MEIEQCRWGILGTAGIAKKNYRGIWLSGNGRVAAVASRSLASAQRFIHECQGDNPFSEVPEAVDGYERLLDRSDIDAVYIPLPTALRKEWVIRAAEKGKHVLCEKPIAVSAVDAQEMVTACEQHGVQFMDGVMFMHSARLPALQRRLASPDGIGKIQRITSNFTFLGDATFRQENIRTMKQLEPFGCLGDLGWYNLRFTLWAMDWKMPHTVIARNHSEMAGKGSTGPVPGAHSAELLFEDGVSASFFCSFTTEINQWGVVSGERGYVHLDDFVLPFFGSCSAWSEHQHLFHHENCRFNMQRRVKMDGVHEYSNGEANAQEVNMLRRFAQLVYTSPDPFWGEIAVKTQILLDACQESAAKNGQPVAVRI